MTASDDFKLGEFEQAVFGGRHEQAASQLLELLRSLQLKDGGSADFGRLPSDGTDSAEREEKFLARLAAGISQLFSDPGFEMSEKGFQSFLIYHRWIAALFAASAFGNADQAIDRIGSPAPDAPDRRTYSGTNLRKLTLLYGLESDIPMPVEAAWSADPAMAVDVAIAQLSSRICISAKACEKRESHIAWLPSRLEEVMLSEANLINLFEAYMHCSYSLNPHKHAVKTAINRHARGRMELHGVADLPLPQQRLRRDRPLILVANEWVQSYSAMYRCYAPSIRALRERFELRAVVCDAAIDDAGRELFDEVTTYARALPTVEAARQLIEHIRAMAPDMIFFPSVGMIGTNVILSAFRLAPIQFMCLGHPATSMSPYIDYVLAEEGYISSPDCFSERLVALPDRSQPWVPLQAARLPAPDIRKKPDVVRIAVTASMMKLNSAFLDLCRSVVEHSSVPVEFQFFCAGAVGIAATQAAKCVVRAVPGAVFHSHIQYDNYLERLNRCDLFLSPFPFGNTNGIVDAVRQGLPGICLDGDEVHAHIDAELFRRLALPGWLTTRTLDNYRAAVLRLVAEHDTRAKLSAKLLQGNPDAVLFEGKPRQFMESVWWLHENHETVQQSGSKLVRPVLPTASKPVRRVLRKERS